MGRSCCKLQARTHSGGSTTGAAEMESGRDTQERKADEMGGSGDKGERSGLGHNEKLPIIYHSGTETKSNSKTGLFSECFVLDTQMRYLRESSP